MAYELLSLSVYAYRLNRINSNRRKGQLI